MMPYEHSQAHAHVFCFAGIGCFGLVVDAVAATEFAAVFHAAKQRRSFPAGFLLA